MVYRQEGIYLPNESGSGTQAIWTIQLIENFGLSKDDFRYRFLMLEKFSILGTQTLREILSI
jgi:hypothetical protein